MADIDKLPSIMEHADSFCAAVKDAFQHPEAQPMLRIDSCTAMLDETGARPRTGRTSKKPGGTAKRHRRLPPQPFSST